MQSFIILIIISNFKIYNFYMHHHVQENNEEIEKIESMEVLLKNLDGKILIRKSNDLKSHYGFFIFLPDHNKQYRNILNNIKPFLYNRFLIVWPQSLVDISSMDQFVSQFWEFRLINVIILHKNSENSFNVYTYDPYSKSICNDPGPLILTDVWSTSRNSFANKSYFYPLIGKLKNLDGCKLICFAKTRPPDSIVKQIGPDEWELEGIGGKLMEEVRKRINFTSVIQVPKMNVSVDKYGYDISEGFPELVTTLLDDSSIDLAFGIYSHIIYDNPKLEFSTATVMECYGWAVPSHAGKTIPMWMYYIQEFSFAVWILISIEFCLSVSIVNFALHFWFGARGALRWIHVVALHLGIPTPLRIKFTTIRIVFAMIILYSLIICSAYQSSLGSFLTVPWKREQIKTFQEILKANYTVIGVPQAKRILRRFSTDYIILNKLSNNFQVHRNHFDSLVLQIQQRKDTVTFGAKRFIEFYVTNELPNTNREDIYFLPQCVIQAHASPFLFKKASPLIKPINRIILAAVESGLIEFWFTVSTPKINKQTVQAFPLTIYQMKCAFGIVIVGNCLAFIIFIYELKSKRR